MKHYRVARDIEAEVATCHWCSLITVLIGGEGQCENGCPGYFHRVKIVTLSRGGVVAALKKASRRIIKKKGQ